MVLPAGATEVVEFPRPPNLLLITADDLGIQLGCYGDPQAVSPRLDALAKQAVRFETAWVTAASCSPSRSSMLTGFYPHQNGQHGLGNTLRGLPMEKRFRLDPWVRDRTLMAILKRRGYRTAVIGKLHVNPESAFPMDMFERRGFTDRRIADQVDAFGDFIDDAPDRPWLTMFNLFDPHVANHPKPMRGEKTRPRGTFFPERVDGLPSSPRAADAFDAFPFQRIDDARMLARIAGYYNCVERLDAGVGLLLDRLDESGQADRTVVVFIGDHGPPVGRSKTTCYEAGLRIPFLVRWPGVSRPHVSDRMVSTVDIVPTFLDAAGADVPADLPGRTLRKLLQDDAPEDRGDWREHLFAEHAYHTAAHFVPRRCVRGRRYKLIENLRAGDDDLPRGVDGCPSASIAAGMSPDSDAAKAFDRIESPPRWELYDLKNDPWEWNNLADDPAMVDVLERLRTRMRQWQRRTNDPALDDPDFYRKHPGVMIRRGKS